MGRTNSPLKECRACKRETVNADEDPKPVKAGKSATLCNSISFSKLQNFKHSRKTRCSISEIVLTSSTFR